MDYKTLYYLLFNAITDSVNQLHDQNYLRAEEILIRTQQRAEELVLRDGE